MARSPAVRHRLSRQDPAIRGKAIVRGMRAAGRVVGLLAAIAATGLMFEASAGATTIKPVVIPGGIEASLVHERAVPLFGCEMSLACVIVSSHSGEAI